MRHKACSQREIPALPLPEKQAWHALIALCIGFFMILLDQSIVAVATATLQKELDADYNEIIWVTSAYLLSFAVPLLMTGRLGDRYGPKNIYILGMVIFTISSCVCGLSSSMLMLIIARAMQGIGAALLTPQTMSVINRVFARDRRGAALGAWGMVGSLASFSGPLAGGYITQTMGWQWIFFINIPIGFLSVFMVARYVPRFATIERKIDLLSIVLSVCSVFAVVFALLQGERAQWAWWIWALVCVGLAIGVLFVLRQRSISTDREPLMPLDLFHIPSFAMGNVGIFCMGFVIGGTPLPIMLYLQQVHQLSPLSAGFVMAPMAVIAAIFAPFVGRLSDKRSPEKLAACGFSLSAVVLAGLCILMSSGAPLFAFYAVMVGNGIGNVFIWAPNSASTMRDVPMSRMGIGSGIYNTTRQLGSVVGSAAIGAVLQWRIGQDSPGSAYAQAVILGAVVLCFAVVSALSVRR
ncbi:MFS transporter [Corynebacterium sp. sy039]|uniref:MFS transporter n=1 Tax=Corynebacterium sp. sy039 TaxID=2599641 RepID=UPI0011B7132B|nr:MFS transporter [Corynebacterium sp. sy039]QDZ42403.1 MFS transporter [Corynebacterium sp. sy039]